MEPHHALLQTMGGLDTITNWHVDDNQYLNREDKSLSKWLQ